MKREMKSNLLKIIILSITLVFFTNCSFLKRKNEVIVTPEMVLTSIFLDDAYSLNKYLSEGFPIDYRDSSDKTLLMDILDHNSLQSLNIVLTRGIDTEIRDNSGRTAIFYVRSLPALQAMKEAGANINVVSTEDKDSLLVYFIKEKSSDYSTYLIKNGSDFSIEDKNGWNALFWSVTVGEASVVKELKNVGANYLEVDDEGNYPIYYAYDEETLLELLDIEGYNLKLKNKKNENILGEVYLRAVANGYIQVVGKLFKLGVNPRYISYGDSAMSIANKFNNIEMIKFLKDNNIK